VNHTSSSTGLNRRRFLALTGAAVAVPSILSGCATRAPRRKSANDKINIGVIGWGMQGPPNTKAFLAMDDCRVIAACDLDAKHLQQAVDTINEQYKNQDCAAYRDYRELLARDDIDAVMIAVPDHWHALIAIEAARRGKDIYGEKPLAKTIAEQQAIVQAVQKTGIIWQTGSWQRSRSNFHKAAEIVRNGMIGRVTRVEVGLPSGHNDFLKSHTKVETSKDLAPIPAELDYEFWCGSAEVLPYRPALVHMNWRWNYNTGGGQLLDWVGHHCDIAHWGLDFDSVGPTEVSGQGEFPPADAVWNTCTKYRLELQYPKGINMTMAGGHDDIKRGTKWIGTDGWVWVDREKFEGSNEEWSDWKYVPDELRKVKLTKSLNHQRNFIDCVRSRKPTLTPVEVAHNSAIPGHLGLIAMQVGRKVRWDHQAEKILGDAEASARLSRAYRSPWRL
jgi:predicted dehydrogenase